MREANPIRTALALCAALALGAPAPGVAQTRALSYEDSFPIGGNGLCEAQIVAPGAGAGLFDRGYRVVCRDAAAPVGSLWVVRGGGTADIARYTPEGATCRPAETVLDGTGLETVATYDCAEADGSARQVLAVASKGNRTYAGVVSPAYRGALAVALRSLAVDAPQPDEISIPLTETGDAAAFARVQARSIATDAVLAEAYRRSNAGAYAEAAEFFAQSAAVSEGASALESDLNRALLESNLGNFAAARKIFAAVASQVGDNPVLARLVRNYVALDALNAGQPAVAIARLDERLPVEADALDTGDGLRIGEAMAQRLKAEVPSNLTGASGMTALERADLLDGQAGQIRATALRLLGRNDEAATALAGADARLAGVRGGRVSSILWLRGQVLGELAELREAAGDLVGAKGYYDQAVALIASNYPGSPVLLSTKAQLAAFYARQNRRDEALGLYRELVADAGGKPAPALRKLFRPYFAMLAEDGGESAAAEMLAASQLLQRPGLAQTQAVLARELSGGSDEASQLFRKAVNLGRAVEQARNSVAQLSAQAGDQPLVLEKLAQRRAELTRLEEQQVAVQDELGKFPRFRAVSDDALTLANLREVLRPGEAYLKLVMLEGATYAVFTDTAQAKAYRVAMSPERLEEEVDAIRATIVIQEDGQAVTYPFDIARARGLYSALLDPVDAMLGSVKHLVFEPDGAMLKLPLNLLVADDASVERYTKRIATKGGDDYDFTGTNWLGSRIEVTTTVSPSAFRDVRRAPRSAAQNSYIGFGQNTPLSTDKGTLGTRAAIAGGEDCLWNAATWDHPIKADELFTAARSLGATGARERILTGDAFTDTAVLGLDNLDEYRILHFATHGLVTAPNPGCPPRPALLTSLGGGTSDGLLSFGEIFDLDLDADLVILSACDTAGAATVGATREAGVVSGGGFALDGLVRAFVGAGARNVVASHWQVPDDYNATNRLIDGFFTGAAGMPIAAALRTSQLALMAQKETSHPFYWSAFAVIGDGATAISR